MKKLKEKFSHLSKKNKLIVIFIAIFIVSVFVNRITGSPASYKKNNAVDRTESATKQVATTKTTEADEINKKNSDSEEKTRENETKELTTEETTTEEETTEEPTTEEPTTEEPTTEEPTTEKPKGVTPSFKETMDSYEAFFDEYVSFMNRYMANPTDMSLMMDYLSFMTKYTDYMDAIDSMDEDEMSDADLAYYLEVTARIESKLLQVAF